MEVRAFKLPPLPGRKNPPIQIVNRANRLFEQQQRVPYSISKKSIQKQDKQNSNDRQQKLNRPSSVRSFSRQSINSRQSREDRNASRQKSVQLLSERINHNVKARVSMPSVSAKSWAIYQIKQKKLIYGKRMFKKRQIASLTKIMNLITIIELIEQLGLQANKIKIKVTRQASLMTGTTSQIKQNYQITLYDLYYGMMLPSGNDSAQQIAQIGGTLLHLHKIQKQYQLNKDNIYNIGYFSQQVKKISTTSVIIYLAQMNKLSKKILMKNSHFANAHGLSNPDNYSCAQDLCKLCAYCMQNQIFRNIVRTQYYSANYSFTSIIRKYLEISTQQQIQSQQIEQYEEIKNTITSQLKWQNTNKMLKQNWSGIKTGITPNAGPCLAASVQKYLNGRNYQFLVILISSITMEARWKEVKEIVEWVIDEKIYI